jgi:hypothetical protein
MLKLSREAMKAMSKEQIIEHALALQAELDRTTALGSRPAAPLRVEHGPPGPDTWRAGGKG